MAILSTEVNKIQYVSNGTVGPYTFPYLFLQDADLQVIVTEISTGTDTTQILGTDYTCTGAGVEAGGSITFVSGHQPATTAYRITIIREVDYKQETDYTEGDNFPAETHENALTKLTMECQQLKALYDRSIKAPATDTAGLSELPKETDRASKYLAFDADGDVTVSTGIISVPTSALGEQLMDVADAATARTLIGMSTFGGQVSATADAAALRTLLSVVRPARVLMIPVGGVWKVYDESGNLIDTSASTTSGLQEAITYAYSNTLPLFVTGGGTITCTTAITVPAGYKDGFVVDAGITIAFGTLGASNLITFNSHENCDVKLKAIITQTAGNTGAVIALKPTSAAPTTGNTVLAASRFEFGTLVPASGGTACLIDIGSGGMIGCDLFIDDINGGTNGVKVTDPGTAFIAFQENTISWNYFHGMSGSAIKVGTSTSNQSNLRRNKWICGRISPVGASSIAFETYGRTDLILNLTASNEEGALNKGLVLQSGANGNNVIGFNISSPSTSSIENNGTGNIVIGGGIAVPIGGATTTTVSTRGTLSTNFTPVGTDANTSEKTLMAYTVPARAFNSSGQIIRVKAWGSFAANANNKTVKIYIGSTARINSGAVAANGLKWIAELTIICTGSSTQRFAGSFMYGNSLVNIFSGTASETDTATINLSVTGQNGTAAANDTICESMVIEYANA